jgi:hypothetical protein
MLNANLELTLNTVNTFVEDPDLDNVEYDQINNTDTDVIYTNILGKLSNTLSIPFDETLAEVKVQGVYETEIDPLQENEVTLEAPAMTSFFIVKTNRDYFDQIRSGDYIYFVSESMPAIFHLGFANDQHKNYLDVERHLEQDLELVEEYVFNRSYDDRTKNFMNDYITKTTKPIVSENTDTTDENPDETVNDDFTQSDDGKNTFEG